MHILCSRWSNLGSASLIKHMLSGPIKNMRLFTPSLFQRWVFSINLTIEIILGWVFIVFMIILTGPIYLFQPDGKHAQFAIVWFHCELTALLYIDFVRTSSDTKYIKLYMCFTHQWCYVFVIKCIHSQWHSFTRYQSHTCQNQQLFAFRPAEKQSVHVAATCTF